MADINFEIITKATALSTAERRIVPVWNVWHFQRVSSVPTLNKTHLTTAFVSTMLAPQLALMSVSYVMNSIWVRCLDDASDPYLETANTSAGGITGDSIPSDNNVTMVMRGPYRGHFNHGMKRFAPLAKSATLLDSLTSAAQTAWTAFCATILAGFVDADTNTWLPIIFNRKGSQISTNPTTVNFLPVQTITYNVQLGLMRRRAQLYRRP